ncbi:MAG: sigma-70 family RNA polymerase sigma factor [Deltaproteobacteria bacterium]|nr:sigma-70 family RNA polymerase sigma factor [Deltaproteobacteria bacterium]
MLGGCLESLNRVQRDVVTLRMLEELSGEEVAEQLALEPGHVAVLLYRAKKSLAPCLTAH